MAEQQDAAPPKKKSKLMLFIIIGVLVLVAGGAGAFLLLKKKQPAEGEEGEEPAAHGKADKSAHPGAPPAYVKLDTFTTNLASENPTDTQAAQYIQVVVELKVEDAHVGDTLKPYTPEIRNGILRALSSKKASQLATVEGKDALAEEILSVVNKIVNPGTKKGKEPEGPVSAVLFSSFIIQ